MVYPWDYSLNLVKNSWTPSKFIWALLNGGGTMKCPKNFGPKCMCIYHVTAFAFSFEMPQNRTLSFSVKLNTWFCLEMPHFSMLKNPCNSEIEEMGKIHLIQGKITEPVWKQKRNRDIIRSVLEHFKEKCKYRNDKYLLDMLFGAFHGTHVNHFAPIPKLFQSKLTKTCLLDQFL